MHVCGIIAEYNPFHNGHAYQIRQAKEHTGCDYIIVVMSGDFVQRGAPALTDKYMRARMALHAGADLVLMLPVYGSTASAEGFARAGVAALHTTGVTDTISFGCEDPHICDNQYQSLAQLLAADNCAFFQAQSRYMSSGLPYAKARIAAIKDCFTDTVSCRTSDLSLLDTPNNLLAFEYLRAIAYTRADLTPCPITRQGSYHASAGALYSDSRTCSASNACLDSNPCSPGSDAPIHYTSASACRELLLRDPSGGISMLRNRDGLPTHVQEALQDYSQTYAFLSEDDLSACLHYALLSGCADGFADFYDCGRDLSARIGHLLPQYECFSQFCDLLKNKSVTRARIARVLTHIVLRLPDRMSAPLIRADGTLPYLRVLGFRKSAGELLHALKLQAKAPVITRCAQMKALSSNDPCTGDANAHAYFSQDLFAADIYRSLLNQKCGQCYPDDFRRKIEIV